MTTMTPEQIRLYIGQLGLNQTRAALMLGISREQMHRLISRGDDGKPRRTPNLTVQRLLSTYLSGHRPGDWIGKPDETEPPDFADHALGKTEDA